MKCKIIKYTFFVSGYSLLRNRKYLPIRFFSPFRFVWRKISNYYLPKVLNKPFKSNNLHASDFLKSKGLSSKVVVSFTSFPKRIDSVWMVVECLKRQSIIPDIIILYLSKEQFPSIDALPENLTKRIDDIFEVKLVDGDIRSHKKYFYSFKEYKDDLVVLVDDDIFYPLDLIESLIINYVNHPDSVICRFGYTILRDNNGELINYRYWPLQQDICEGNSVLFGTGGGSLYHPSTIYVDCCRKDLILKMCPLADDIWINAMVRLSNNNIVKMDCGGLLPILSKDDKSLFEANVLDNRNDVQLQAVDNYYYIKMGKKVFAKNC